MLLCIQGRSHHIQYILRWHILENTHSANSVKLVFCSSFPKYLMIRIEQRLQGRAFDNEKMKPQMPQRGRFRFQYYDYTMNRRQ